MNTFSLTFEDLKSYCFITGWNLKSVGLAGELWSKLSIETGETFISIPFYSAPTGFPYEEQVQRIAEFEKKKIKDVLFRIKNPNMDVLRVVGSSDVFITESIPLKAGVGLIGSTYKMLRASATTARQVKSHIGSGYFSKSDLAVAKARLGQTEVGSYVVPILMPLSDLDEEPIENGQLEITKEHRQKYEPFERRVMRTYAQSLEAICTIVTQKRHIPNKEEINHLISVGVSREFVNSINDILKEGSVSSFVANFDWAPSNSPPTGVPKEISIDSDSQEFLTATADKLSVRRIDPVQVFSGPVVFVEYFPQAPVGTIGVQVMRNKRSTELIVHLNDKQMHDAMKWMDSARPIIVSGKVEQDPGKRPRIVKPSRFNALDQDYLPTVT